MSHSGPMPNIIFYGERGIINAIVLHMSQYEHGFNQAVKAFLQAVHWAVDKSPEWIDCICDAHAIVELGFGQFGDPDLILVCRTHHSKTYVVFIIYIQIFISIS